MAKKKKRQRPARRPDPSPMWFDFPPDIFWLTPEGAPVMGLGHISMIQRSPEAFGFHSPPETKGEQDAAITELLGGGWVRGRYTGDRFYFEMDRPRATPMKVAYDVVLRFERHGQDVVVDFPPPYTGFGGKPVLVKDFLDQKFPIAWGLNPRPKRRKRK